MRTLNTSNYALLYEQKQLGYHSFINEAEAANAPAANSNTISVLPGDSEEVKALKNCVISKKPAEAFSVIDAESAKLAADANATQAKFSVKIGETDYKVVINKTTTADNKIGIWIDYDSAAKVIEGLDLNYITTQLNQSADRTFLGVDFGTNEEKLAAVAGAIYAYCYDRNVPAKDVLKAIGDRYEERFSTPLLTMIDEEFTGSPDVFARGLFGAQLTASDVSTALAVDAGQSILFDLALTIGSYALTAGSGGAGAPLAVVQTARFGNAIRTLGTLGRTSTEVRNLRTAVTAGEEALTAANLTYRSAAAGGTIVQSAEKLRKLSNIISLSAQEVNALRNVQNFSSIQRFLTAGRGGAMTLNGNAMAAEMAKDGPGFFRALAEVAKAAPGAVKALLTNIDPKTAAIIVGGAGLAIDVVPDTIAAIKGGEPLEAGSTTKMDENTLTEFCDALHKEAQGYTGGDAELKIAFAMLSLTPETWKSVNAVWDKSYGKDDGSLYDYCVDSELSGDLAVLVDGYLGGIAGVGELAKDVEAIKSNLEKGAVKPGEAEKVSESTVITSFSDFLRSTK